MAKFFKDARRDPSRGWIAGVCAGIGNYYDISPKWIRFWALLLMFFVFGPFALVIYVALWYLLDPLETKVAYEKVDCQAGRDEPAGVRAAEARATAVRAADLRARLSGLDQRLGFLEECVSSKEFELRREFRKLEA